MSISRPAVPGLSLVISVVVGACAAAVPGYQPPNAKLDRYKAHIETGGGFEKNGTYQLTDQEKQLNCKQLTGAVSIKIVQMRDAVNRPKPSAGAALAQDTIRPFFSNSTYGVDIERDLATDRARLEALNRQLAAKTCATFDLDADLRPGNTDRPHPIKATAKAKHG